MLFTMFVLKDQHRESQPTTVAEIKGTDTQIPLQPAGAGLCTHSSFDKNALSLGRTRKKITNRKSLNLCQQFIVIIINKKSYDKFITINVKQYYNCTPLCRYSDTIGEDVLKSNGTFFPVKVNEVKISLRNYCFPQNHQYYYQWQT